MRLRKILPFLCLILLGLFPCLSLADPSHTTIWDFDEDVTSVVPHEDGFIVLAGTQLWFCDPSLEQPEPQLLLKTIASDRCSATGKATCMLSLI